MTSRGWGRAAYWIEIVAISSTKWRWNKAPLSINGYHGLSDSFLYVRLVSTEYLEIPSNTLFVISFARRSGYTIVGKAKNIFLIVNVEMRIPASTQTQN